MDYFPKAHIPLREGDIILGYGPSLTSAAIACYGAPAGPCSHSGMYYRDARGRGRILSMSSAGLRSAPPGSFLNHATRLALVRIKGYADTSALSREARDLYKQQKTDPITFDFSFERESDTDRKFLCNELVSYLYIRAGFPDPFVKPPGLKEDYWIDWMRAHTGINLLASASPNAALNAKGFTTLAQVEMVEGAAQYDAATWAILRRVKTYIGEQFYEPKPPSFASRVIAALERSVLMRRTMQAMPAPEIRELQYAVAEFLVHCRRKTLLTVQRHGGEQWSNEDVARLAERVCDQCRDKYFRKATRSWQAASK